MSQLSEVRLIQAKQHFTHYSHIFREPTITSIPILDEYFMNVLITIIFASIFYCLISSLSYLFFYKWSKDKYTPNEYDFKQYEQKKLFDLKWSIINILFQSPLIALIKTSYPYFSKIQYNFQWRWVMLVYIGFHIIYDQFLTYWIHRMLHHPILYRKIHYIHHQSKTITPFSGFAFHPLDAFAQAIPVFTSCFFVPLPINFVILHGLVTSLWAISIHDNVNMIPFKGILYAGSHTIHHFPWGQNYNYGKITSICDRLYGSYCDPEQITGYGYKPSQLMMRFCDKMNQIYIKLIPDRGLDKDGNAARLLVLKKRQQILKNKQK